MTQDNDDKIEIRFAPGCFDNFDGTQDELDELMAEIEQMIDDGSFFEKSTPLDLEKMFEEDPMEAIQVAISLGLLNDLIDENGNIIDAALDAELTESDREILRSMFDMNSNITGDRKLH